MTYKIKVNGVAVPEKLLTAAEMRTILGFRDAKDKEEGYRYTRKDGTKGKFVLDRNRDNRLLKLPIAERYGEQIFHGIFAGQCNHPSETCNGETIIIDSIGQITSGAHRGVGLILAQEKRDMLALFGHDEEIEQYQVPEIITLPALVVEGIDPTAADTVDQAIPRQMGDVLYRRHAAGGKELSASARAILNRELSVALRLVWLRLNGDTVKTGGKFTFPDALKFLEGNQLLVDCITHVHSGNEGNRIGSLVSLGYAAGAMYLAAYSGEDRDAYEKGEMNMNKKPANWEKAEKFWTLFGQMSSRALKKEDNEAIHAIVNCLDANRKSDKKHSRDAICTMLVRGWEGFTGFGYRTPGAITKGLYKKVGETEVLMVERFGGLDLDKEVLKEHGWVQEPTTNFGRLKVDDWKVGDTCWVEQPNIEPWFGSIVTFDTNGKDAIVAVSEQDRKDGEDFEFGVEVAWLRNEKPKYEPKVEEPEAPKEKKAAAPKPPKAAKTTKKVPPKAAK